MKDRGEPIPAEDSMQIAKNIKERYGYVCEDIVEEYKSFD
jgi:actin-related protein 3